MHKGYGITKIGGKTTRIHRAVYEHFVGRIPPGLTLDHLCRNRACCNPAHLEPVSVGENVLRGVGHTARNAAKTHCDNGHEFTPENTYVYGAGWRQCLACNRARKRARRAHQGVRANT